MVSAWLFLVQSLCLIVITLCWLRMSFSAQYWEALARRALTAAERFQHNAEAWEQHAKELERSIG